MHLEVITVKGVIYARYSSDNQREESIEGQLRECNAYAEKQSITIVDTYIDRALSPIPQNSDYRNLRTKEKTWNCK